MWICYFFTVRAKTLSSTLPDFKCGLISLSMYESVMTHSKALKKRCCARSESYVMYSGYLDATITFGKLPVNKWQSSMSFHQRTGESILDTNKPSNFKVFS